MKYLGLLFGISRHRISQAINRDINILVESLKDDPLFQKHRNIAAFVKDLFKSLCNRNNLSLHVDDKASAYVPKPAKEDKQMHPKKIGSNFNAAKVICEDNVHHKMEKKIMGNGNEIKDFVEKEIATWNLEIMDRIGGNATGITSKQLKLTKKWQVLLQEPINISILCWICTMYGVLLMDAKLQSKPARKVMEEHITMAGYTAMLW